MAKQAHVFAHQNADEKFSMEDIESSTNKHRNKAQYERELRELEELEKELKGGDPNDDGDSDDERDVTPDKKDDSDDKTNWKKRYGDLRSYLSQKENEWKAKEKELNTQLKESSKTQKVYPKTEEEIKNWIEEYPDVGAIIQTIAGQTSDEAILELKAEIETLRNNDKKNEFQAAYNKLLKLHPDFDDLRVTDDFQNWLSSQPPVFQSALTNPTFDDAGINAAGRVVDMYKSEKGLSGKKKKDADTPDPDKQKRREAAESIRSSAQKPDTDSKAPKFSESQVEAMTDEEFLKNEEAILESQRAGTFVYDLQRPSR